MILLFYFVPLFTVNQNRIQKSCTNEQVRKREPAILKMMSQPCSGSCFIYTVLHLTRSKISCFQKSSGKKLISKNFFLVLLSGCHVQILTDKWSKICYIHLSKYSWLFGTQTCRSSLLYITNELMNMKIFRSPLAIMVYAIAPSHITDLFGAKK